MPCGVAAGMKPGGIMIRNANASPRASASSD